jgi:hypothetical protein
VLWGKAAAAGGDREGLFAIAQPWLAERPPAEVSALLRVLDGVLRISGIIDDGHLPWVIASLAADRPPGMAGGSYAAYETERIEKDVASWRRIRRDISRHR